MMMLLFCFWLDLFSPVGGDATYGEWDGCGKLLTTSPGGLAIFDPRNSRDPVAVCAGVIPFDEFICPFLLFIICFHVS
jgi:hypothetical protein